MKKIFILSLFLVPFSTLAAFSGLILTQSPEISIPGSDVRITASVIDRDVSQLEFVWLVDGRTVVDAVGQNELTIVAPLAGDEMSVVVEVRENGRVYATEGLKIQPAALFIEWEGKTAVPPFYSGKRLVGPQGAATVIAVPNFLYPDGSRAATSDIFFEWRVNGVQRIKPTLGKSSAEFELPLLNNPLTIGITATTRDGRLKGQGVAIVTPTRPEAVVYESSPLGGLIDQHAIQGSHTFKNAEVTLAAFPLYTSSREDLAYEWFLSDNPVEPAEGLGNTITFRKTGEGTGSYPVRFSYTNPLKFLEQASFSFLLQF